MKKMKTIVSLTVLALIIGSLIYKNIMAPQDDSSGLSKLADMAFPIFMGFSFLLLFFKRREEKKDSKKITHEDRELFKSVGISDYDNKKKN